MHDSPKKISFFPIGYHYHRAPTPLPSEWDGDLKEISKQGYTHVQFRPQWRWHERIQGKPVFDDLERLFDLAKKHNLLVVLKPMLETAPDWVFQDLDGTRIGFGGKKLGPYAHAAYYVGGWWPCFDNRKVIKAATEFTGKLVKRFAGHSALWFYDVWNEPVNRPMGACQCPDSILSYRNWLKAKFGSIEEINEKLGKAWTSYDTLMPPQDSGDYTEIYYWKHWSAWALSEAVKAVADTIRKNDPKAFLMVHAGGSSIVQDPIWGVNDDMQTKKSVDMYGTSFGVCLKPNTPMELCSPELISSWLKRVDPSYWCHEFYPNSTNWSVPPTYEEMLRQTWMAVAGGTQGITIWQYRGERFGVEANCAGAREIDGSKNERSRALDRVAGIMKKHGILIEGTKRVKPALALFFDRPSDMIGRIETIPASFEDLNNENAKQNYAYKQSVWKANAIHLINGEPSDFVIAGDDLSVYKMLHVTAAEMISEKAAEWLKDYVRKGGNLLVEYPFASRDTVTTWVNPKRPSHGLESLLGCSEGERHWSDDSDIAAVFGMKLPAGNGVFKDYASRWYIELKPCGGKVIGKWQDNKPAMIKNKYGKGTVWTTGFNASLAFKDRWDDPMLTFFRTMMGNAGIKPKAHAGKGIFVMEREGKKGTVIFVINPTDKKQSMILPAKLSVEIENQNSKVSGKELKLGPKGIFVALLGN